MNGSQSVRDMRGDAHSFVRRQVALLLHVGGKVLARKKLHHQKHRLGIAIAELHEVEDVDDVRVADVIYSAGLFEKPTAGLQSVGQVFV